MTKLSELSKTLTLLENRQDALGDLDALLRNFKISADLIGGVALASYNYVRNTEDIDILVSKNDYGKVADAIVQTGGHSIGKENKFSWRQYVIQINYSGLKVRNTTFSEPSNNEFGLKVIDLPTLLKMKIEAGLNQHRHRTDVIELIKRNNLPLECIAKLSLPSNAANLAIALWKIAQEESES